MTDTCFEVLRRWGLQVEKDDLSFIDFNHDPKTGQLNKIELADTPADGSFNVIGEGRRALNAMNLGTCPEDQKITRAYHLLNFGHVLKAVEENHLSNIRDAFNPVGANMHGSVVHWVHRDPDYLKTATDAGFELERVLNYTSEQVGLIALSDVLNVLEEIYGLEPIKIGEKTIYVEICDMSQAQSGLFKRVYPHLVTYGEELDGDFSAIFEMPLSMLKYWPGPSVSPEGFGFVSHYQSLTGPDYTPDINGERKIELDIDERSLLLSTQIIYLKPHVAPEKEAEFTETLKVMAKTMGFHEAIKSAYYLSGNS